MLKIYCLKISITHTLAVMGKMSQGQTPRRANGQGSLYEVETVSGKRWQASKTVGFDAKGKAIRITGSAKLKTEAWSRMESNIDKWKKSQGLATSTMDTLAIVRRGEANLTITDWAYRWLENLAPDRVSVPVRQNYQKVIENHIAPAPFGSIRLKNLQSQDIRTLIQNTLPSKLKVRGEGAGVQALLGLSALSNIHTILGMMLKSAVLEGKLERNPINAVSKPKPKKTKINLNSVKWTAQRLNKAIMGHPDEARWLLAMVEGLRQSEVLGLTWDCIHNLNDEGRAYVEVKQQLARHHIAHGCGYRSPETKQYPCGQKMSNKCPKQQGNSGYYINSETKSEAGHRIVPLVPSVVVALKEHKRKQQTWRESPNWKPLGGKGMDNLVFTKPSGMPIRQQDDTASWHQLLSANNIEYRRSHTNRHIAISIMIARGANIEFVRAVVGHSAPEITRAIYTHLTPQDLREPLLLVEQQVSVERKKAKHKK